MAVGDALRRLCEEVGWSYAVFWKAIGAADPVHLVWEDGFCGHASCSAGSEAPDAGCEPGSSVCTLVRKIMASQIHVVGEGTIGRAAFTGNHQWIIHDPANDHSLRSEVSAEINHQFVAGIRTIAIIPVLPRGVLQLGSTNVVRYPGFGKWDYNILEVVLCHYNMGHDVFLYDYETIYIVDRSNVLFS